MRKYFSFCLALLLLAQSVLLPVGVQAATTQYTVWLDADGLDMDGCWELQNGVGSLTKTNRKAYSGNAYAWNRGNEGAVSTAVLTLPATGGSGETALVFWMDSVQQVAATAGYAVKLYTGNAAGQETCFRIKAGGEAALLCDEEIHMLECGTDQLILPNGLAGWVVIPFTSFEKQWGAETAITSGSVHSLFLQTGTNYGSILYLDDIGFATDDEAFINAVYTDTLRAKRPSQCEVYGHTRQETVCTESVVCARCDQVLRQAAEHTYNAKNICSVCGYGKYNTYLGGGYYGATADNAYFRTAANGNTKVPTVVESDNAYVWRKDGGIAGYGTVVLWSRPDKSAASGITLSVDKGQVGDKGIAVWLGLEDSPEGVGTTEMRLQLRDSSAGTSRCWRLKEGASYYSVVDGKVEQKRVISSQILRLPESYQGWVVIPYEAFELHWGVPAGETVQQQTIDPTQVNGLNLYYYMPAAFTGRVQLDEFGYVTDIRSFVRELGVSGDAILNKLDGSTNDGAWADSANTQLQFTFSSSQEGAALQVTTEGDTLHLAVDVRQDDPFCIDRREDMTGFTGLGFWISAPNGAAFRPCLEQLDGSTVAVASADNSAAFYRLVNTYTGVTHSRRFEADGIVYVPAGFTGWVVLDTAAFDVIGYDMTQLRSLGLTFAQPTTVCVDTLYGATSAAGLIANVFGYPMDTELISVKAPAKAALSVSPEGEREILLYEGMSSADFLRAVTVRGGYRYLLVDAADRQLYGYIEDMRRVATVEVYLGATLQETYRVKQAQGSDPCEQLGHSWTASSCVTAGFCAVCGVTQPTEAVGHRWKEATCTVAKTCTVCYVTEGEALGHNWTSANCGAPQTCVLCGVTVGESTGEAHSWSGGSCTGCGKPLFTVAQDFESGDGDIIYSTENAYSLVSNKTDFGQYALLLQRGSTMAQVNLNFQEKGRAGQVALAFWYDLTDNGSSGEFYSFRVYPRDFAGNLITLSGTNVYYTVIDGVVSACTSNENMAVKLPNHTSGWVVLPIPGNSSWQNTSVGGPYYGTMVQLTGINITLPYRNGTRVLVDQFAFVEDISAFTEQAAAGNINMTGCTNKSACAEDAHQWQPPTCERAGCCAVCGLANQPALGEHQWQEETCVSLKTCTVCGKTEGEISGHTYGEDGVCTVCGIVRGDMDADSVVSSRDAVRLLYHCLLPSMYPIMQSGDVNGDGLVNSSDAVYLLYHTLLPNLYPLLNE